MPEATLLLSWHTRERAASEHSNSEQIWASYAAANENSPCFVG